MKKLFGLFLILLSLIITVGCKDNTVECPICPGLVCPDGYELALINTEKPDEGYTCVEVDKGPSCGDLKGDLCSQSGECPEGYSNLGITFDCNPCCAEDAEPPPPVIDCSIYYTLTNIGTPPNGQDCDSATGMMKELCFIRHYDLIWAGYRNPKYAIDYCGDKLDDINISYNWLNDQVDVGDELIKEIDRKYLPRMADEPNTKCPGRSVVRKEAYKDFKARYNRHMDTIDLAHKATQDTVCRDIKAFDNLQGWCCKCYGRGPNCAQWVQ